MARAPVRGGRRRWMQDGAHTPPPMDAPTGLLEREAELSLIGRAIAGLGGQAIAALGGQASGKSGGPGPRGHCLVVEAPAGFGKTSLLRAVRAASPAGVDWLWGTCEPLVAPPPLGALVDLIDALPPSLAHAVREGRAGPGTAQGLLTLLRERRQPLVLVIDDLQWADSATQDLLRFLARRIDGTRTLLLLALRDDTAPADPVRALLASLPAQASTRLALAPLSPVAVARLAEQAGRDPAGLHRATQGHPFFVTQLLAAPPGHLPLAVRDVVLARLATLPPAARDVVALISLSPRGLERPLLDALLPSCLPAATPADLEAALGTGWLELDGPWLRFGHDIARQAVAEAVPPLQAAAWHQALFEGLGEQPAALLRRVHHARLAGLHMEVQTLAPVAAREATGLGAHRQAKTLYELALQGSDGLPVPVPAAERAALHEAHAQACSAIYALEDGEAAWRAALQAQHQAGQPLGVARALRELGRMAWHRGAIPAGIALVREALQCLEQARGPSAADPDALGHETAIAQATMAQLHLMDERPLRAVAWGEPALAVFEARGDLAQLVYTLNTVGAAQMLGGQPDIGWQRLQRGLALGLARGDDGQVARAYTNLAGLALITHQHQRLHEWVAQGLDWCATRDQDMFAAALRVRLALGLLQQGRWAEARTLLQRLRAQALPSPREDEVSVLLLALLDLREGRPPAPGRCARSLARHRRRHTPAAGGTVVPARRRGSCRGRLAAWRHGAGRAAGAGGAAGGTGSGRALAHRLHRLLGAARFGGGASRAASRPARALPPGTGGRRGCSRRGLAGAGLPVRTGAGAAAGQRGRSAAGAEPAAGPGRRHGLGAGARQGRRHAYRRTCTFRRQRAARPLRPCTSRRRRPDRA